jgi:hypothetical protein
MKKLVASFAAVISFALLSACSSPAAEDAAPVAAPAAVVTTTEAPVSWNGTWTADGFSAVIKDEVITISIVSPDSSSLYWQGTWPASMKATDGVKYVSKADVEALSMSLLGSQDKTKDFTFKNDELTFSMSMMGTTRTVRLQKS